MRRRLSLAAMMGVVLYMAIAFAALKAPSMLWASGLYTAVVVILLIATLRIFFSRGAGLRGFVVFGWGTFPLMLLWIPLPVPLTAALAQFVLVDQFHFISPMIIQEQARMKSFASAHSVYVLSNHQVYIIQIAQLLLAVPIALIGAMLARWLAAHHPHPRIMTDPPGPE